jgi:multiple sugar transport system substrate-binding protein
MKKTNISRRQFLQLTGSTVGVALLAACAPAPAPGGAAAPAAGDAAAAGVSVADDTPLWVIVNQDFHPDYNTFIRAHIETFAREKGWPMELADMAGFVAGGAALQKIAAAVAADDAPDALMHNLSTAQMKSLGITENVTDIVDENIATYGALAPLMKTQTYVEDGFYAVPFHGRAGGGYARGDLFEAKGIDLAKIRLYDELREACLEVSDPSKEMFGWGNTINRSGDGNTMIYRVLTGFGVKWVDETGQFVTLDSPETVDAINWIKETYTDPKWQAMMPPGVLSWTDPSNNEAYLASKIAYTQNAGTVLAKAYFDKNPVAEPTVFHPMCGGPAVAEFNGQGSQNFILIKGGKNPEAARELIKSFFIKENMDAAFTNARTYAIPAYESMWEWPIIKDTPQSIAVKPTAVDPSGYSGISWPGPLTPQIAAVDLEGVGADMVAAVMNGQSTPEEAVKAAQKRAVDIFKTFGAPGEK